PGAHRICPGTGLDGHDPRTTSHCLAAAQRGNGKDMNARRLWVFVLLVICSALLAQQFLSKPVKLIVPYPPRSTPDIVGRTLSSNLQDALAQPVVVENRTGAGGNIGAEAVAK